MGTGVGVGGGRGDGVIVGVGTGITDLGTEVGAVKFGWRRIQPLSPILRAMTTRIIVVFNFIDVTIIQPELAVNKTFVYFK